MCIDTHYERFVNILTAWSFGEGKLVRCNYDGSVVGFRKERTGSVGLFTVLCRCCGFRVV
jgi:hypothetical protein